LDITTYHINKLDHLNAAKIKFTLQQETDLDALILKENIIKALTESGYKVISSIQRSRLIIPGIIAGTLGEKKDLK
jgi:superfamily II DNA/RNA helicase